MYKVTEKRLRQKFAEINRMVFDGKLEYSAINVLEIEDSASEAGWCVPEDDGNVYFGVMSEFPCVHSFTDTLAHEMIHLHQIVNDLPVNHGKFFKKWANIAESCGYYAD